MSDEPRGQAQTEDARPSEPRSPGTAPGRAGNRDGGPAGRRPIRTRRRGRGLLPAALANLEHLEETAQTDEIIDQAVETLRTAFGADTGAFVTYDAHRLTLVRLDAAPDSLRQLFRLSDPGAGASFMRERLSLPFSVELRQPDARTASLARQLAELGYGVAWGIPLAVDGRADGAIGLLWRGVPAQAFDAELLGTVGSVIGTALASARLREALAREVSRQSQLEDTARIASVVVNQVSEALIVTDAAGLITAFNPAAQAQYGCAAAEAIGRAFDDIIDSTTIAGTPLGDQAIRAVAATGHWHGRVVHRPSIGSRVGQSLVVESDLTALRDEAGRQLGIIGVNREVTESARLEGQLASLGALAVATGRARTVDEVARAAVDTLIDVASADAVAVIVFAGDDLELVAQRGLAPEALGGIAASSGAPPLVGRQVRVPGTLIRADVDDPRLSGGLPQAMRTSGLEAALFTGLHVQGQPIGYLVIAWRDRAARQPNDAVILQAAGQVAVALASASLTRETAEALERERRLTTRLQAMVELTLLPEAPEPGVPLARQLLKRVVSALNADSGYVGQAVAGGMQVIESIDLPDLLNEEVRRRQPRDFVFWRRLAAGAPAFFQPFDSTLVNIATRRVALACGLTSYAAFPLATDGELRGCLVVHFRQPIDQIPLDARTLDAVGRTIAIAAANHRLTESLGEAVRAEQQLTTELQTLQDLTLLGSTARDLETLARETTRRIMAAVGAQGGAYMIIDEHANRFRTVWSERADPNLDACLSDGPVDATAPLLAFQQGQSTFIRPAFEFVASDPLCARAAAAGLDAIGGVALRVGGYLAGIVRLEWRAGDSPDGQPLREESARRLDAASRIASISLANFRLREELIGRMAAQRALAQRLDTLHELTRVGEIANTIEEVARRTAVLVRAALGARAVAYGLLNAAGGVDLLGADGIFGDMREQIATVRADEAPAILQQKAGGGPVLWDYEPGRATGHGLRFARASGIRSYAVIPVRFEGTLRAVIFAVFEQPVAALTFELAALESVAHLAGISLANFHLRDHLVASETRYRMLFEESIDAIRLDSPDGTVIDANDAAVRLYGGSREDLIGRPWRDLIATSGGHLEEVEESLRQTGRASYRATSRRLDGSEFTADLEVRTIEIGGVLHTLVLTRDATEAELMQAELLQAQKMEALGQLVAGVAHELNNPLTAIIAYSQMLQTDGRLPADMRHDASMLVDEARRTSRIVEGLLDYARQRPPERQSVAVAALAQSVFDLQSYPLWKSSIVATLDIPDDIPPIEVDRSQLQQVLLNLTLNSIQAIGTRSPGGATHSLVIAARRSADGRPAVRLMVTDDGPGIPPAIRDSIFNPFFTTKEPGAGTGLGLSVTRGLVEGHHGRIWYEPGPGGIGCRFVIELPVAAPHEGEQQQPAAVADVLDNPARHHVKPRARRAGPGPRQSRASPGGPRPSVLVVDDESSIRDIAVRTLTTNGFDCVAAATGPEALQHLGASTFDVLLVDHRMAGMSGTEFFSAASEKRPLLGHRTVFMSGDVLNPDLHEFARGRGIDLLAKPFGIETLLGVVQTVVEREGRAPDPAQISSEAAPPES